ncbi:MAG: hypothetical protein L0221_07080 [Chloroflexi bacterium]|nr:hypothetical protein [Chloroflexota bacterium]
MPDVFEGLLRAIGNGITSLVGGAFEALGAAANGMFDALQALLPGFWLPVVAVAVTIAVGWQLIKR